MGEDDSTDADLKVVKLLRLLVAAREGLLFVTEGRCTAHGMDFDQEKNQLAGGNGFFPWTVSFKRFHELRK